MEISEELGGILEIESLVIQSGSDDNYMSCTEDFEIAAVAEMMHAEDVRSFEAHMDQDTPDLPECICCVNNLHQDPPAEFVEKPPLNRHVTFEFNEMSATSTQLSESQPSKHEGADSNPIIRRSSRIQTRAEKRKSSDNTPDKETIRKRKSDASLGSTPKIRRTQSLSRASKSPVGAKGSNQKVAKKRKSTGSAGRPRRRSGKFNKN